MTEVTRPRLPRSQVEIGLADETGLGRRTRHGLADELCRDSLSRGDAMGFAAQATISAKLPPLRRA